jgi:hypothetical protein
MRAHNLHEAQSYYVTILFNKVAKNIFFLEMTHRQASPNMEFWPLWSIFSIFDFSNLLFGPNMEACGNLYTLLLRLLQGVFEH